MGKRSLNQKFLIWVGVAVVVLLTLLMSRTLSYQSGSAALLRDREKLLEAREQRVVAAIQKLAALGSHRQINGTTDTASLYAKDDAAPFYWQCPTGPRGLGVSNGSSQCNARGNCNATTGRCVCSSGFAGYSCDADLRNLRQSTKERFERRRQEFDAAFEAPSKSGPSEAGSNQLFDSRGVGEMATVVVPYSGGTAGLLHLKQLLNSIHSVYPTIQVVVSVANLAIVDAVKKLVSDVRDDIMLIISDTAHPKGSTGEAWNRAIELVLQEPSRQRELILLLSPDVVRFHEHTNLELAVSQMLTTDVDVLGFMTLAPFAAVVGSNASSAKRTRSDEYLLISDCWRFRHRQWMMKFDKPPFGYSRHEKFVMYCDRTSNSFLIRRSFAATAAGRQLFDGSMNDLVVADFFAMIASHNRKLVRRWRLDKSANLNYVPDTRLPGYLMVGTCSECLLIATVPKSDHRTAADMPPNNIEFGKYLLPPPLDESLHAGFAEKWQVEAYFPPVGRKLEDPLEAIFRGIDARSLAAAGHGRLVCVKTGGIYSHSKRGLFAPLCHRYERQRDFAYLAALWTGDTLRTATNGDKNKKTRRRYGISLHHGNLFGALRMGQELLWETDGDIDFISFDDSHDEMMARWDAFLQHAQTHAGFEVKVTYPEKPWYVSLLRDKTDFQVNCRGVKSELTRGKPPQVHNLTVWYQGVRSYVNGFQNPWKEIRSDPGHDYRVQYLAQQGWVLNFAKQSIGCFVSDAQSGAAAGNVTEGAFAHNACLPPCNDPFNIADHNLCSLDEGSDFSDWRDMQPVIL